jgi:Polysaccharide biosynthesis/export protein
MRRTYPRAFWGIVLWISILPLIAAEAERSLQQGDTVLISIANPGEPSKSTFIISDTGEIDLPYIGRLHAAGKSPSELANSIRDAYLNTKIYSKVDVTVVNVPGRFERTNSGQLIFVPENSDEPSNPGDHLTPRDKIKIFRLPSFEVHVESRQ